MENDEFSQLMLACTEVAQAYREGVVFIGGIAVYLHAINSKETAELAEFTHVADLYISLADLSDLRDSEELVPNRRLGKHQMMKRGFEFDIYAERNSALIVPYDAVMAHCATYDKIKVASLEHLLVLKLEAFRDRQASVKGEKDAKDMLRIASVAAHSTKAFDPALVSPYLRDDHLPLLDKVEKGGAYALSLVHGNAVQAKRIRTDFIALANSVRKSYKFVSGNEEDDGSAPRSAPVKSRKKSKGPGRR